MPTQTKINKRYFDYKNTEELKKFLNPHGKFLQRRKTGLSVTDQKKLALAVKRARFLGLLPYVAR